MLPVKFRRAVGHMVLVLSMVSLLALTGLSHKAPVAVAAVAQEGEQTVFVEWNITATGQGPDAAFPYESFMTRRITIQGSAVVHKTPGELNRVIPFQLTVTDDMHRVREADCYHEEDSWSITDPARYTGGPDPYFVQPTVFEPRQRADGSWYMWDPFDTTFYFGQLQPRNFTYRHESVGTNCYEDISETRTYESGAYTDTLAQSPKPLEGDGTGTVFTRSETFTGSIGGNGHLELTINYNVTIRLACGPVAAQASLPAGSQSPGQAVCGCAALPQGQVIDASNPIITNLEVSPPLRVDWQVPLDTPEDLYFEVTCEGRRVRNAEVEITVKPEPNSGSHAHDDNSRPRGYLNGTEITSSRPSIKVTTNARGLAEVQFKNGDELVTHINGIAGIYVVKARSTRFPYGFEASIRLQVAAEGLQALGPGANYQLAPAHPAHPQRYYGRPATLNAIGQLADAFRQRQAEHNADLRFYGQPEWPIASVLVSAISLPDGGLFDLNTRGWWQQPFGAHNYGYIVMLQPLLRGLAFPVPRRAAVAWLEREFRRLGAQYGTWLSDAGSPWNLDVEDGVVQAMTSPAANGPDLATVAFLADPADRWTAGVGQTVTYTLGLENLTPNTQAHGVVLTATLPTGLTFLRASPAPTRLTAGQPVWELATLDAEAIPRIFDLTTRIEPTLVPGTVLTVTAQASTTDPDANLQNNTYAAFGLRVQPAGADLTVASTLAATAMIPGQPVTFTVEVANVGNVPAAGTVLTLTLPASVTLLSALPVTATSTMNQVTWQMGGLVPGSTRPVTASVALDPALAAFVSPDPDVEAPGVLTYTLQVGSASGDFDGSNNVEQTVKAVELAGPDLAVGLALQGSDDSGMLTAGTEVTYTVLYGNFGNRVAPTTTVTVSLWAGLSLLSAEPEPSRTGTSPTFGGGVLAWDVGAMEVGETGVIVVRVGVVSVPAEGSLVLAAVESGALETAYGDNVALDRRLAGVAVRRFYLPHVERGGG